MMADPVKRTVATTEARLMSTEAEWSAAHPAMTGLKPGLTEANFLARRASMLATGYELIGLPHEGAIVSVAGVQILPDVLTGRALRVHDFATRPDMQGKGFGLALLRAVEDRAAVLGCPKVVLYSRLARNDAHRFYQSKGGYSRSGEVFVPDRTPSPGIRAVSLRPPTTPPSSRAGFEWLTTEEGAAHGFAVGVVPVPNLVRGSDLRVDTFIAPDGLLPRFATADLFRTLEEEAATRGCSRLTVTVRNDDPALAAIVRNAAGYPWYGVEFEKLVRGGA